MTFNLKCFCICMQLTIILVGALGLNSGFEKSARKDKYLAESDYSYPCPSADDILPCTCSFDSAYNVNLDCSGATSQGDLDSAFNAVFPFDDVTEFIISNETYKNEIGSLTAGTFDTKSFELFTIETSYLEIISDDVFTNSHDTLLQLRLHGNEISEFIYEDLPLFTKLRILDLSSNKLTILPEISSDSLVTINLSNNQNLKIESENVFAAVPNLSIVRFTSINLSTMTANLFLPHQMISEVFYSNNIINIVPENAINAPGPTLTKVHLNNNNINTVEAGSISGLAPDCELDLSNNQIQELPIHIWQSIFDSITPDMGGMINLESNPLICGCDIAWIYGVNTDYLRIISPATTCAAGANIHELDPGFFGDCDSQTSNRMTS